MDGRSISASRSSEGGMGRGWSGIYGRTTVERKLDRPAGEGKSSVPVST